MSDSHHEVLMAVRDEALARGATFADARMVVGEGTSITRQDGRADRASTTKVAGVGVRVLRAGTWGFASTASTDLESALECLQWAFAAARVSEGSRGLVVAELPGHEATVKADYERDPRSVSAAEKMDLLRAHETELIRVAGDRAVNTVASLSTSVTRTIVCNTHGTLVDMETVRARIGCSCTTVDGDVRQSAHESRAATAGWEAIERIEPTDFSIKAAERAVALLSARRAPAGKLPVVLHPSLVGVFVHEAFGHNAEADLVLAGDSILEGKEGTDIASELVTIVDDSTMPGLWGSYQYDSEGTPGNRRVLVERGKLVGFMHSLESAGRMGKKPNGSGRADGYDAQPIVRMSNTCVLAGETPVEEMIRGVDYGVLFENGQWGYVQCEKGQYTAHAGSGRMIRNGELCEMVRDVSMCGMVLETLRKVDAVSREWEVSWGGGMCGKDGQGMPVSGGGPYLRISEIVVGGQEA